MPIIVKNNMLEYSIDKDGIGMITIDQTDQPANWYSFDFVNHYIGIAEQAIANDNVIGVIVTSGKKMFMPGGDLRWLIESIKGPEEFFNNIMNIHKGLRTIETGGKPFVAAINGTAVGGGMELCLSCHYRIVLNDSSILLGFPESTVGLLPGSGGTVKTPYLLGLKNAFLYLLQGIKVDPKKAVEDGLVNEIANSKKEMFAAAKRYIKEHTLPIQPWDDPKYNIPGGGFINPEKWQMLVNTMGNLIKTTHGNYPAPNYILSIIHDGLNLPIDRSLEIEARYSTKVSQTKEAKNMIRTGFFGMQEAKKGRNRPNSIPPIPINRIVIQGSNETVGLISCLSAKAGIEVVIYNDSTDSEELLKSRMEKQLKKDDESKDNIRTILNKIIINQDITDVENYDLIIEAVTEFFDIDSKILSGNTKVLIQDQVLERDTPALPNELTSTTKQSKNFIKLHFLPPYSQMSLVEILIDENTSQKTIAAAIDFVVILKKVPLVVKNISNYYVSRCLSAFYSEVILLLDEGVPAVMIENIALKKGMPEGPLSIMDKITMDRLKTFYKSDPAQENIRSYNLLKMLIDKFGRLGRNSRKGFYDYSDEGKKKLWPDLSIIFSSSPDKLSSDLIGKRMMHRQALESFKCLDEGVINSAMDGNIGSVLGWGFPIYAGGAVSYIDFVGVQQFINDCQDFKEKYGERWSIPDSLQTWGLNKKSILEFKK